MQPVERPLAVHSEILDRGFHLHDQDRAVVAERHHVGAPARAQRHLRDERQALGAQPAADAAADGQRALGLAAINRQAERLVTPISQGRPRR